MVSVHIIHYCHSPLIFIILVRFPMSSFSFLVAFGIGGFSFAIVSLFALLACFSPLLCFSIWLSGLADAMWPSVTAWLATLMAAKYPERVHSLLLIGAAVNQGMDDDVFENIVSSLDDEVG